MAYVDGFNLYYGIRSTPYKWLDIARFCQNRVPNDTLVATKYFTALVDSRPHDPDQPVRQQIFLRALATLPNFEIILGRFIAKIDQRPLSVPPHSIVSVLNSEEKGSDVNIASHLLNDAHYNRFDMALLVSNDSDLATPVRMVAQELGKPVWIISPFTHVTRHLLNDDTTGAPIATLGLITLQKHLKKCRLPNPITDATGTFYKPSTWA